MPRGRGVGAKSRRPQPGLPPAPTLPLPGGRNPAFGARGCFSTCAGETPALPGEALAGSPSSVAEAPFPDSRHRCTETEPFFAGAWLRCARRGRRSAGSRRLRLDALHGSAERGDRRSEALNHSARREERYRDALYRSAGPGERWLDAWHYSARLGERFIAVLHGSAGPAEWCSNILHRCNPSVNHSPGPAEWFPKALNRSAGLAE